MIEVKFVITKQMEGDEAQRREIEDNLINNEIGPLGYDVEICTHLPRRG